MRKILAELVWTVPPPSLSQHDREGMADVLSAYANDLRKNAAVLDVRVTFSVGRS